MLACCSVAQVSGQLTARNADTAIVTSYLNTKKQDTIFVFNQKTDGNLSLTQSDISTFKWYRFNEKTMNFEEFDVIPDVTETSQNGLKQGGYRVTVMPRGATAPRDTFVAWLYMNPGFDFSLYKNKNGEVVETGAYRQCTHTDFRLNPEIPTIQSSFTYYQPGRLQQALTLNNKITFTIRLDNGEEVTKPLNTQGNIQYLRHIDPPHEDTRFYFRAYDRFGVERKDDIMYRTILPYVELIKEHPNMFPKKEPRSAPVPVKFICNPNIINLINSEYVWDFGNGDNIVYNFDKPPPDTIMYTYFTPRSPDYQVTVKVTSMWGCTYTTDPVFIPVDRPSLGEIVNGVAKNQNIFTPNDDKQNDYFKPYAVSLRQFEIWIYTRAGKQVYYYRGDDLREWQGWDGRIEKTGREAAEGMYYYTIKAVGWDEPSTRNPKPGPYSGSFHLFR